ncbi:hypothetical protein [Elizabethkingia anophelis]|uniref:hypothetical protein n=1 Tax=Elizabethkingia anophelis TaxID=1117645 RepID=UPI001EE6A821|nr:hypothetical protein [Elizabethkingia anophelis]UKY84523.1 hypothetical protein KUF66_07735 [Elizabethkingia anophelis]
MKNKETEILKKEIKDISKKFKDDKRIKEYEKSLNSFKELVQKGYAKERGNNLSSITEQTSNIVTFNI